MSEGTVGSERAVLRLRRTIPAVLAALLLAGCSAGDGGASATPPAPSPAPVGEVGLDTFVVPDLVGLNLQAAQYALQALGSYVVDQEDALGLGRVQVVDRNWIVCRQSPDPGTSASLGATVTLWAAKLDERCP